MVVDDHSTDRLARDREARRGIGQAYSSDVVRADPERRMAWFVA
jgi:hypothetical protein